MPSPYLKLATATLAAAAQAIIDDFDSEVGPCTVEFYTGTIPASPATAIGAQVKLGTVICAEPAATKSGGVITFGATTQDDAADTSGTATWARVKRGAGTACMDCDVTDTAGTGVLKANTVTFVAGGPIKINSLVLTVGG